MPTKDHAPTKPIRNCVVCDSIIPQTMRRDATICSPECQHEKRLAYYRQRSQTPEQEAAILEARRHRSKTGMTKAGKPVRSGWRAKSFTVGRISCVVCGGPLPADAGYNRKTCSPPCLTEHRREYLRRWHEQLHAGPIEKLERHKNLKRKNDRASKARQRLHSIKREIDDRTR